MSILALTKASTKPLTQQLFNHRQLIPLRHDVLWRIERGAVRTLTWSDDSTRIILGYWGPGDVVGSPLSRLNPYQIECLTSVEMSILPSELWKQALDAMLLHIQQTEELLNINHRKSVSLRLWQFLVWLSQKFGRDVEQGRLIDLSVTHQELAEAISATRVSVTRMLQEFESEGRLQRHSRRFVITSSGVQNA